MAIPTPAEVWSTHSLRLTAEVQAVTSKIVEALRTTEDPKRVTVAVRASHAAQTLLIKNFRERGWKLSFGDNLRDGDWVTVTAL